MRQKQRRKTIKKWTNEIEKKLKNIKWTLVCGHKYKTIEGRRRLFLIK
jgi:hypothetical protein